MPRNASYLSKVSVDDHSQDEAKLAFGEKVRSLMNNLSLSQSELARQAGLRRDAISTYVRGKVWPDPANLRKLANALGVIPSDLIPGMSEIEAVGSRAPGAARPVISAPTSPALQMDQVKPGVFRLRFDQVLPLSVATQIIALLQPAE